MPVWGRVCVSMPRVGVGVCCLGVPWHDLFAMTCQTLSAELVLRKPTPRGSPEVCFRIPSTLPPRRRGVDDERREPPAPHSLQGVAQGSGQSRRLWFFWSVCRGDRAVESEDGAREQGHPGGGEYDMGSR